MPGAGRSKGSAQTDRERDGLQQLRNLESVLPLAGTGECLLRDDDHIARSQLCFLGTAVEQTSRAADDRTVGANHEDGFLVSHVGGTASLMEVPARALSRLERHGGWVVNGAIHHHNVGLLGYIHN